MSISRNLSARRSCVLLDAVNQPIARTSTTESETSAPMVIPSTTASGTGPIRWPFQGMRIAAFRPSTRFTFVDDICAAGPARRRYRTLPNSRQRRSILPELRLADNPAHLDLADKRGPLPLAPECIAVRGTVRR